MKSIRSITRAWVSALAFSALSAGLVAGAQAATVLSSQAPDPVGDAFLSSTSTQNAETFTLSTASSITGFRWFGTEAQVSELVVRLYDSAVDGTNSDAYTTPAGTLTRGASPAFTVGSGLLAIPVYQFELTLGTAIAAAANSVYSVAIFSTGNIWAWQTSLQGDGISFVRGDDGTDWTAETLDLALTVLGPDAPVGVPEPTSLALVGLALAAAGRLRRRRA